MQRLLVTGVDNVVGSNLALALADRFDVFGLPAHDSSSAPWGTRLLDGSSGEVIQLTRALCEARPHWVIHCSGLSINEWDQEPITLSGCEFSDHEIVAHLLELTGSLSSRLTVVVSDALFNGPAAFHAESSRGFAGSPLAQRIRNVEAACCNTEALVVRTHAYGWGADDARQSFAERLLTALSDGGEVETNGGRYASPILAADLADLLAEAYRRRLSGVVHLPGAERTNQWRFACELAQAFALESPQRTESRSQLSCKETSLRTSRGSELQGTKLPLLREGLARFAAQHQSGWQSRCGWRSMASVAA